MSNDEMTPGRFLRWAVARKKHAWIVQRVKEGRTVVLSTHLKGTRIGLAQLSQVRASRTGLLVRHGSKWLDYSHAKLTTS